MDLIEPIHCYKDYLFTFTHVVNGTSQITRTIVVFAFWIVSREQNIVFAFCQSSPRDDTDS